MDRWLSPNGFAYKIVLPEAARSKQVIREIPASIKKPLYANVDFECERFNESVPFKAEVHSQETIKRMRKVCQLAKIVLQEASQIVKVSLKDLSASSIASNR